MPDGLDLNFCTDIYYTTRNNERNDFDMINFAKFMEAMEDYTTVIRGYVESYDSLTEGNTIIYPKNSKDPKNAPFVIVRNKKGGGRANSSISHNCSVKFRIPGGPESGIEQAVPNTAIVLGRDDIFNTHYEKNCKRPDMKKYMDGLYSFVYKYQMAICAVWYSTDQDVIDYLNDKLADVSDINLKSRLKPRTAEELSQDRAGDIYV